MKKSLLMLSFISLLFASCTKSTSTSINPLPVAAYSVSGISDVSVTQDNEYGYPVFMPITLNYNDSSEQTVTVSISGFPTFIKYGTKFGIAGNYGFFIGPWSGIPSFSIPLEIYYDYALDYSVGNYPITVTCRNAAGATRIFTFNLVCR